MKLYNSTFEYSSIMRTFLTVIYLSLFKAALFQYLVIFISHAVDIFYRFLVNVILTSK